MPTLSKPRRRSRRLACENAYYEVFLDDLADDSGDVREYLVVAPKKSATYLVTGVAVLPVVKNRYALLRIYRHAIQDYSWEVPRGFVEEKQMAVMIQRSLIQDVSTIVAFHRSLRLKRLARPA